MARTAGTGDFATASNVAINTILAEEANRIGSDVHTRMMHTSPWIDLVKKSAFPEGMGYQLNTLIYDRSLPTKDVTGNQVGTNWNAVASLEDSSNAFGTSVLDQPLNATAESVQGANGVGGGSADARNYVNFGKQLKNYSIQRAIIESPRINVDDLRYAAHRQEQLRAVLDSLAESTRHSWAERYRDEYDRLVDNTIICRGNISGGDDSANPSEFLIDNEGQTTDQLGAAGADLDGGSASKVKSDISNAVLDKTYFKMIRGGGSADAYGRENGRPVFALVCSSEASNTIMKESGFRDDIRYNNARVGDLIAPLGVEKSFRGFYHLIDDLAPRYKDGSEGDLVRVEPYTSANGIAKPNSEYDGAAYEVAYVLHPSVYESQIPAPFGGTNGLTFNPVDYSGEFKWTNILSETTNPDGTIGFFRGILAAASKPIKTELGFAIVFKRTGLPATV
mgnify:CR=1 FL=1|tara:strand:+ start:1250 stop:2599 length:1350 start_codon:yes stop_codon:yes gene_type:complete